MDEKEIRDACLTLLGSAEAAYVTTIDEKGNPQTRCMFNLRNKAKFPKLIEIFEYHTDDFMTLFTTNTSSAKIAQITKHPAVSVYYCKPDEFHGLMLSGNIEIVNDPKLKERLWHEGWERYYPTGPNDPDHTVLRLLPTKARGWYKGRTFEFEFGVKQ